MLAGVWLCRYTVPHLDGPWAADFIYGGLGKGGPAFQTHGVLCDVLSQPLRQGLVWA
jgi:hypothetical protein